MICRITLLMLMCCSVIANNVYAQQKLMGTSVTTKLPVAKTDSTKYFHSGAKGYGNPIYDKIPEYRLMEDSSYYFAAGTLTRKTICTYTGTDFTQSVTQSLNNGTWRNSSRVRMVYKSSKPDSAIYESFNTQGNGSWRLSALIVYTWSGNNMSSATRYTRGGGRNPSWVGDWKTAYAYSGGNMTDSTFQDWNNSSKKWEDVERKKSTWVSGRLTKTATDVIDAGGWKPGYEGFYTYDGSGRLIDLTTKRNTAGAGAPAVWGNFLRDSLFYKAGNNTAVADTLFRYDASSGGSYINIFQLGIEHTPLGQMSKVTTMRWDGISKYEYGPQDSTLSWYWGFNVDVNDVKPAVEVIKVYPSPASNMLHIALEGIADKQVQFAIVDMQGRVAKVWAETAKPQTTIDITALPAGNYVLRLDDGTQMATKKFAVVK